MDENTGITIVFCVLISSISSCTAVYEVSKNLTRCESSEVRITEELNDQKTRPK